MSLYWRFTAFILQFLHQKNRNYAISLTLLLLSIGLNLKSTSIFYCRGTFLKARARDISNLPAFDRSTIATRVVGGRTHWGEITVSDWLAWSMVNHWVLFVLSFLESLQSYVKIVVVSPSKRYKDLSSILYSSRATNW